MANLNGLMAPNILDNGLIAGNMGKDNSIGKMEENTSVILIGTTNKVMDSKLFLKGLTWPDGKYYKG